MRINVKQFIPELKTEDACFIAGVDCAFNGTNAENSHFTHFATKEKTQKWEQGIYNIGTGRGTTVNEIADMLKVEKKYVPEVPEQIQISLMTYKAKSQGWEPKIKLEEGINI